MYETINIKQIKDFDAIHVHTPFNHKNIWSYLSVAIRFFQRIRHGKYAYYSHTAFFMWEGFQLFVYEADPEVKRTLFRDWIKNKKIAITHAPTTLFGGISINHAKTIVRSKLATKYDYLSLAMFQVLYVLTGKWYGTKNSNSFYCSELYGWIMNVAFNLFPRWFELNPASCYKELEDRTYFKGGAEQINFYFK